MTAGLMAPALLDPHGKRRTAMSTYYRVTVPVEGRDGKTCFVVCRCPPAAGRGRGRRWSCWFPGRRQRASDRGDACDAGMRTIGASRACRATDPARRIETRMGRDAPRAARVETASAVGTRAWSWLAGTRSICSSLALYAGADNIFNTLGGLPKKCVICIY